MKYVLTVLGMFVGLLIILTISFIVYEQNKDIREYKRAMFGVRADYHKLQNEYEAYRQRTQNMRHLLILSQGKNSKNTSIGDTIYQHANKVLGDISVYYKNLTTGESVIVDGDRPYYMASLYKVILTLYLLDEVKKGTVTLTSKVGSGSATLEFALNKIITESNNEYAQMLADEYGWFEIQDAMREKLGIDFSFNKNLELTVKNAGLLFENIALSLRISDTDSNYLLELLKDQKKTSKLPKYLPKNIYSHNKTGEFDGYSHDAGIFYTPKANYILIFMSKTNTPAVTNEQMALMSKEIFEILNENGASPTPIDISPSP